MSAEPPTDSLLPTRQSLLSRLRDWQDQRGLAPIFRELLAADLQCRSQVRAGQFGEQKPGSGVTADSHAFLPDNYADSPFAPETTGPYPTADCLRLVHRDVKPGNIIYVSGRAKLADIGPDAPRPAYQ
jgi:hypothetical protein